MTWEKEEMSNLCEITSSKRIFYSEYVKFGIPFYRSKEIIERSQGQEISEPLFISEDKYIDIKSRFLVPVKGDLLLTSVGTIGIPYVVREGDCFYFKDGNLTWFRNFSKRIDPMFLFFWFRSNDGQGILNNITIGSSQKALTISALKKISIPLPPLSVQRRIADILSAYDDLIENNRKQIKLLEEAAQRLYKEWFVDLRFPGYENTSIVDGVPEGWLPTCIGNAFETTSGGTPSRQRPDYYKNGTILWVKTQELNDNYIIDTQEKITENAIKKSSAKKIPSGSILLAMYGATIGKLGIAAFDLSCNQACCAFIFPENQYKKEYLYCWLIDNRNFLISQGKGAAQSNLSQALIKSFKIVIPSQVILRFFSRYANPLFKQRELLEKQVLLLVEARDRLLPKLMNGELEV